jgi:DNA-binding HxlR family transcriptional regulator
VAGTLDLLGDRWTLLVVRDLLFVGARHFGDFLRSPEGIPTNILTERLRRLECAGLVTRTVYRRHPPRYEYQLTERGRDLLPVLREMIRWANRHIPGTATPPPGFFDRFDAEDPETKS